MLMYFSKRQKLPDLIKILLISSRKISKLNKFNFNGLRNNNLMLKIQSFQYFRHLDYIRILYH
jgi:hypothetical protein